MSSFLRTSLVLLVFLPWIPGISAEAQEAMSGQPASPVANDAAIEPLGLDARIDNAFKPVADFWESLILYPFPIPGTEVKVPIVLALLVFGALYFTLYFVFVNIRRFPLALRVVSGKYDAIERGGPVESDQPNVVRGDQPNTVRDEGHDGEVSHFQALATAVSGTVGLGNIGSVAVAIAVGGPGATFWMIVCGLLGMSTKFVECTLGVKYRDVDADGTVHGGPMYYLKKGLASMGMAQFGLILGVLFAILCVGASLGGGNAFQSNQATSQLITLFGIDQNVNKSAGFVCGAIMAFLVGLVIIGGIKRIATVTEKIVPFMAILYILACAIILAMNFQHVGTAFSQIFTEAFSMKAGLGGFIGSMIVGFQRAAFSNEAGAGSAAIAHSAVKTRYPASEGIVALLEPFIDTVVICTMTALVIILFNVDGSTFDYGAAAGGEVMMKDGTGGLKGVELTSAAFKSNISWFPYVLTVAVVLFAFSTMISWSYYGLQSWKFLFGKGRAADLTYKLLFLAFVIIGASAKLEAVIKFSDAMILALVFPNMIGLIFLASRVKVDLNKYLDAIGEKRFFK